MTCTLRMDKIISLMKYFRSLNWSRWKMLSPQRNYWHLNCTRNSLINVKMQFWIDMSTIKMRELERIVLESKKLWWARLNNRNAKFKKTDIIRGNNRRTFARRERFLNSKGNTNSSMNSHQFKKVFHRGHKSCNHA